MTGAVGKELSLAGNISEVNKNLKVLSLLKVTGAVGVRIAKGLESRRIKEDGDASLFPHQIVDFALAHSVPSHFSTYIFRIHTHT